MKAGRAAYVAYVASVGGKSAVSGQPLPGWWETSRQIRDAWMDAAEAARNTEEVDGDVQCWQCGALVSVDRPRVREAKAEKAAA